MATKKVTIKGSGGQKPITFKKGGLHESTHTPMKDKIPAAKVQKALHGGYGDKAKKQAMFYKNVLKGK